MSACVCVCACVTVCVCVSVCVCVDMGWDLLLRDFILQQAGLFGTIATTFLINTNFSKVYLFLKIVI